MIELLVVIIIIGILAAIALPSFLNQTVKAKQSEAKTYIASINKTQQAYFTEKGTFAPSLTALSLGTPTATDNYSYGILGVNSDIDTIVASSTLKPNLKAYIGRISTGSITAVSELYSNSIICETTPKSAVYTVVIADEPTGAVTTVAAVSTSSNGYQTCATGSLIVKSANVK